MRSERECIALAGRFLVLPPICETLRKEGVIKEPL